jgi:hypothetical protein
MGSMTNGGDPLRRLPATRYREVHVPHVDCLRCSVVSTLRKRSKRSLLLRQTYGLRMRRTRRLRRSGPRRSLGLLSGKHPVAGPAIHRGDRGVVPVLDDVGQADRRPFEQAGTDTDKSHTADKSVHRILSHRTIVCPASPLCSGS